MTCLHASSLAIAAATKTGSMGRKRFPPLSDFKSPSSVTAGFALPASSDNAQQQQSHKEQSPSAGMEPSEGEGASAVEGEEHYEQQSFDGGLLGITLDQPTPSLLPLPIPLPIPIIAATSASPSSSVAGGDNTMTRTDCQQPIELLPSAPSPQDNNATQVESGAVAAPSSALENDGFTSSPGVFRLSAIL